MSGDYVRAKELRAAGMDWTAIIAAEDDNPRARLAAELLARAAYDSIEARAAAFVAQRGGAVRRFTTIDTGSGNSPKLYNKPSIPEPSVLDGIMDRFLANEIPDRFKMYRVTPL
jgi:hypothetical protein